jgi:hypothetical protein
LNIPIPPTPAPSSPSMYSAKPAPLDNSTIKGSTKELERLRKDAERRADEELVKEIADRRKRLIDRVTGIKITVVLMASREALGQQLCATPGQRF